jgi:DNA-directed RNA polymerase specialized sigma24 family protein
VKDVGIEAEPTAVSPPGFDAFITDARVRLSAAFSAYLGPERGQEALAEALGYAWEHRDRVLAMESPIGYLFRVGQSRTRWVFQRRNRVFPAPDDIGLPDVEPGLIRELARLTPQQRTGVVLIHGFQWTHAEVSELLGIKRTTVQNHVERAMARLREQLGGVDE